MTLTFAPLKQAYRTHRRADLFRKLGGGWPAEIDKEKYVNTCAIRMSEALKDAGATIPASFKEAMRGDGSPIVVYVKTMRKVVQALLGEPTWGMSKQEEQALTAADLPKQTGIIAYHVSKNVWDDATGHFDLWTGTAFVGEGKFSDIAKGYALEFWRVA